MIVTRADDTARREPSGERAARDKSDPVPLCVTRVNPDPSTFTRYTSSVPSVCAMNRMRPDVEASGRCRTGSAAAARCTAAAATAQRAKKTVAAMLDRVGLTARALLDGIRRCRRPIADVVAVVEDTGNDGKRHAAADERDRYQDDREQNDEEGSRFRRHD